MKVCLINNLYGENARGGAETIVRTEAEALMALGHEVTVVSVRPKSALVGGACEPKACCHAEPGSSGVREIGIAPRNLYLYGDGRRHGWLMRLAWHFVDTFGGDGPRQVMGHLNELKPDVVHTHNLMGVGFRLPRQLRRAGFRHVHTVHDVQLANPSGLIPTLGGGAFRHWSEATCSAVMRRVFGSPDVVLFPSEFMERFHARRGFFPRSRHEVLRNPAPEVGPAREPSGGERRFLFVGVLEPHKGVRELVAAWRNAALPNATLEIVGQGSLDGEVAAAVSRDASIKQRGRLPWAATVAAYRTVDYLVMPSLVIENAPAVIGESMSAGTPVVTLAVGGIPEMVRDGETGWVIDAAGVKGSAGVEDCLAVGLRRAAGTRAEEWKRMSLKCQEVVSAWRVTDHVERLMRIYRGK